MAKRVPKGIVCLLTALRFHSLGTQHPREVWLAVDRRAGIPRIDFTPVRIVRISGAALTAGVDVHTMEGVNVRVTSPARTVVDCFKFRNKIGVDVAVEALRDYRRLRKGTVDELWPQADSLRMTRVIRPYWDAILKCCSSVSGGVYLATPRFHSFSCIVFRNSSSVTFRYRCVVLRSACPRRS